MATFAIASSVIAGSVEAVRLGGACGGVCSSLRVPLLYAGWMDPSCNRRAAGSGSMKAVKFGSKKKGML